MIAPAQIKNIIAKLLIKLQQLLTSYIKIDNLQHVLTTEVIKVEYKTPAEAICSELSGLSCEELRSIRDIALEIIVMREYRITEKLKKFV